MDQSEIQSLWTTVAPAAWPDAPTEMTVTTLTEIEACPRRWALGVAQYPALWTGWGYPPRVNLGALAGTVVHYTLEDITKGLVRADCPSLQHPTAYQVMKDLGGYTKVVHECIDRVLANLADNPRARALCEYTARSLRARVPELRTRAQTLLCRVQLPQLEGSHSISHKSKHLGPLNSGVYSELQLHARSIGWKGKADLLTLSPEVCGITDFKTGKPHDRHRFQIQVYALLWSRDIEINPNGQRADRLVLAYSNGDVEVPAPTAIELDALENQIVARRDAVHQAVSRHPPEASPSFNNCQYCGVRQLCNKYWTTDIQRRMAEDDRDKHFADIEVRIIGQHGPLSWDAIVNYSSVAEPGQPVLLRANLLPFTPKLDQRIRFLSVHLSLSDEQPHASEAERPTIVATVGANSEAYLVSE
ncbi:PD-(D/E)XK nuclease family protein [Gemmatimonadota bacterium]